jgi:hypothetical protein
MKGKKIIEFVFYNLLNAIELVYNYIKKEMNLTEIIF